MSIERYYGWLSWFQDQATRVGHPSGNDHLTVHRRLHTASGPASGATVHHLLVEALRRTGPLPDEPLVVDAGCGLGGTTFFLHEIFGGAYHGLTLSDVQCRRAVAEASRRGLAERCRFHVRSYDDDLTDLVPRRVDLVVAIESLAHSPDPAHTLAVWGRMLAPGGRVAIVDDMPVASLPDDDEDLTAFRRGWLCPRVAPAHVLRAALGAVGLEVLADHDFTPLVPRRHPADLAIRRWSCQAALPPARRTAAGVLFESWHGGLSLERLYQRGLMEYRLVIAGPSGTATTSSP